MPDPRKSLCYALDVATAAEAVKQVEALSPFVGLFKVGLQLFLREGPPLLSALQARGARRIFLDLKMLDIPRTVRQARQSAATMPVDFLSVHCEALLGGETAAKPALPAAGQQIPAAAATAAPPASGPQLLAVTLLTSLGETELELLGYRRELSVTEIVLMRAEIAREAGCAGVVCSGLEVEAVRKRLGDGLLIVTPGIRPSWVEVSGDDQARTRTAREAIRAGADILVVGRPIRQAPDPREAAGRILDEIEQGHRDLQGG